MTKRNRGLTLVEAMLLLVILSIVAVAAGVGLQAVAKVPVQAEQTLAMNNLCVDAMEQMRDNMTAAWPTTSYSFTLKLKGTTYTSSTANVGTGGSNTTFLTTPTSGTSPVPITISNKVYVVDVAMGQADPAGGTSYKSDFVQVVVTCRPVIGGTVSTGLAQSLRCYVAQP